MKRDWMSVVIASVLGSVFLAAVLAADGFAQQRQIIRGGRANQAFQVQKEFTQYELVQLQMEATVRAVDEAIKRLQEYRGRIIADYGVALNNAAAADARLKEREQAAMGAAESSSSKSQTVTDSSTERERVEVPVRGARKKGTK